MGRSVALLLSPEDVHRVLARTRRIAPSITWWSRLRRSYLQDAILRALRVEEVVAIDIVVGLELTVDATVALLHAPWVPGNVAMEEVPAMGLQVEALSRCIRSDQDPQWMLLRICI